MSGPTDNNAYITDDLQSSSSVPDNESGDFALNLAHFENFSTEKNLVSKI